MKGAVAMREKTTHELVWGTEGGGFTETIRLEGQNFAERIRDLVSNSNDRHKVGNNKLD